MLCKLCKLAEAESVLVRKKYMQCFGMTASPAGSEFRYMSENFIHIMSAVLFVLFIYLGGGGVLDWQYCC